MDYTGKGVDELSFHKGQLIKVTNKSRNVDDGFWTGELRGKKGLFPSMVVEDVMVCGDDEVSEVLNTHDEHYQTVNHHEINVPFIPEPTSVSPPADVPDYTPSFESVSNTPLSVNNEEFIFSPKTSVSQVSKFNSTVDALSSFSNVNDTNGEDFSNIRDFSSRNENTNDVKPGNESNNQFQNGSNSKKSEEYKSNIREYETNGSLEEVKNETEKNNVVEQEISSSDEKVEFQIYKLKTSFI